MRGVRFSALSIAAFRGISDPVLFDLTAPLTLVFAPNGTGKTTMCEAAEWLLTGQVERLKEGKDFDASVLRSKFATDGEAPSAAADVLIGGKPRFLARSVEGGQSPAVFGADAESAERCGPHDLLSQLAPAAAANEAHHLTAINLRQRWLKGTRFLSAEALAALVDTDEETIERRTQVFADLLGIRHLLDAERQCERYAAELSSRLRSLATMTAQRSTEAEALERALEGPDETGAPSVSARSEVAAAVALLQSDELSSAAEGSVNDDKLAALTAVHRRLRHAFDERTDLVARIEAQWPLRVSLEQAVSEGSQLESRLASSLAEIEENSRAAAALLAARTAEREVATEGARALASAKDQLTKLAAELLAILHDAGLLGFAPQTWGSLSESIAESGWTAAGRDQRRRELEALAADLDQAAREAERLRLLDADLDRVRSKVVSEEALAVLRRDAENADTRSRAAHRALEATTEPIARLQSAARDLIAHDHGADATKCPACAYDWGNAESLRAAIAAALDAGPQIAQIASAGAAAASEAATAAHARLDAAVAARNQAEALARERAALAATAERRKRNIQQLELAPDRLAASIAQARLQLDVADALAAVVTARDALEPSLPGGPAPLLPPGTPVSNTLDQLDSNFSARHQIVQLRLAQLVKAIEQASEARDQLRSSHSAIQQELRACRDTLQGKASELASLRTLWDSAAPNTPWSDGALTAIKREVAQSLDSLSKAEAHIQAARAAWTLESRRERLESLRRAIQPSLDRQKHMAARIEAANRARAVFHDTYTTISRKQVLGLSRVVNPLFARMHANRVFDRINLGEDADFLHWLADAGGEQLDPGKDFSQGQRQDLALALFLARARSLGGTFFLDEPVIHLDDLNRVGLLDILRAIVLEGSQSLNLVITTSSRSLARHLVEKFTGIRTVETPNGPLHPLRVIELDGNGRSGVQLSNIYPLPGA